MQAMCMAVIGCVVVPFSLPQCRPRHTAYNM